MDFVSLCRTCLSNRTDKEIAELRTRQHDDTHSDVFMFCLNIKVKEDSKISTKLCLKCFNKILSFYKFKLLALNNDAYLKAAESEGLIKKEICPQDDNAIDEYVSLGTSVIGNSSDSIKVEPFSGECETEDQSDNEFLNVVEKIKYEFVTEDHKDETKPNAPTKRKNGKRGPLSNSNPKSKKKRKIKSDTVCGSQVCEECGKTVKNLKDHSLQHLPPSARKKYPCKECDKLFSTIQSRNKHHKTKHLGIKHTCPICNKKVVSLTAHNSLTHNKKSLPHECVPCGRRFISPSALAAHTSMHTKDRPYVCDRCDDATFRSKICLDLHRRRVHDKEKPHVCQFCAKSFFQKHHLKVHLRSHTKEKPYQCPDCDKSFSSSSILNNHRTIHSEEKRFECTVCNMSFARSGYLRNHMLSHTKEKRYPCKYCGVKFGRSDHRKRHEHTAHENHLLSNEKEALMHGHRAKSNCGAKQTGSGGINHEVIPPLGSYSCDSVESVDDVLIE